MRRPRPPSTASDMSEAVVIGLSAVVVAIRGGEAVVLTVEPRGPADFPGLPFGPFDPAGRTFELALRAFVTEQTGFQLGYVEQLYTFGDRGRDAPLADVGAGRARVVSVGYLALTPRAVDTAAPDTGWSPWTRFFPWEDWRRGRPAVIDQRIAPGLTAWARDGTRAGDEAGQRMARVRSLFALDGAVWNEERVLERYELLYEARLVPEAARDQALAEGRALPVSDSSSDFGAAMTSDHRRILATGLGRLRGKLKYRPVAFELTPPEFTLSTLQKTIEAISGLRLHKQNFRRAVERSGLVEPLGRFDQETGGRPAELHRFLRAKAAEAPALGLPLPTIR